MPTEAEWEKAASWKNSRKYEFATYSSNPTCADANFYGNDSECTFIGLTSIVNYEPELNNTNNMAGNVREWVLDWYNPNGYSTIKIKDPRGAKNGLFKVNRGGSYLSDQSRINNTYRGANSPVLRAPDLGFRCVLSDD